MSKTTNGTGDSLPPPLRPFARLARRFRSRFIDPSPPRYRAVPGSFEVLVEVGTLAPLPPFFAPPSSPDLRPLDDPSSPVPPSLPPLTPVDEGTSSQEPPPAPPPTLSSNLSSASLESFASLERPGPPPPYNPHLSPPAYVASPPSGHFCRSHFPRSPFPRERSQPTWPVVAFALPTSRAARRARHEVRVPTGRRGSLPRSATSQ